MMLTKTIRSPFFYVGDKYKLVPQLKKRFPEKIKRFIEPFCGGGSVYLNTNAEEYILNDVDEYMIKLHKMLFSFGKNSKDFFNMAIELIKDYDLSASFIGRDVPNEYKKKYIKTYYAKYNKPYFTKMREDFNKDKNDLFRLYLLLIYGFNRMLRFNSNGDFNLPVGNVDFNKNVETALNDYFNITKDRVTQFCSKDFKEFLYDINPQKGDFVYLDPPYLITFSEYNKLWNEDNEERLIDTLDGLNSKGVHFAISNILWHKQRYNAIFNNWAQKYNITRILSNYINYHDNSNKQSYEVLVTNY
ncbi:MAG: Dam family site-specific DNA-(adenine-N6)-methyltransferase [Clostridiales Family XIII bacterium]|jgi:DNA adenine methylase|nr:Dam family site-specific DNA-(adenine-N6)-methyltransferase [Clostridiales Family XIII bacterium]